MLVHVSFRTEVPLILYLHTLYAIPPHSVYYTSTLCCEGAPRVVSCFLNSIDNFEILASATHESDLRILESKYIAKLKPSLNSQLSYYPLAVAHS